MTLRERAEKAAKKVFETDHPLKSEVDRLAAFAEGVLKGAAAKRTRGDIEHELDMDLLCTLLRGEILILCGRDGQPSVHLRLEVDERPADMEDALDKIRDVWDF